MKIRDVMGAAAADPLQIQLMLDELELAAQASPDLEIDQQTTFAVAVMHHISCIPWLNAYQRQFLRQQIQPVCWNVMPPYEFTLAFCNGTFVTWTGLEGFFDLKTGQYTKTAPPVFESIAYNFHVRMTALLNEARQGCPSPPETSG